MQAFLDNTKGWNSPNVIDADDPVRHDSIQAGGVFSLRRGLVQPQFRSEERWRVTGCSSHLKPHMPAVAMSKCPQVMSLKYCSN